MRLPGHRRGEGHRALEAAGREIRAAQGTERDEILAARRALHRAEKAHDRRVTAAVRDLGHARAPQVIAAYGHELILYDDRLTSPGESHDITAGVTAAVHEADGEVELVVSGPGWRESMRGPDEDRAELEHLADAVEHAAHAASDVLDARRPAVETAEEELRAAREDRLHVAEVAPLIHRLEDLCSDESPLDLAPGIWTGHEGVLVVTDRRLLFVGLRESFSMPYAQMRTITASGRLFGARLLIATTTGRVTIGGLSPDRAAELVALAAPRAAGSERAAA